MKYLRYAHRIYFKGRSFGLWGLTRAISRHLPLTDYRRRPLGHPRFVFYNLKVSRSATFFKITEACSGWHVEINNGEYKLVRYGIHPKTKKERKYSESNQEEKNKDKKDQKENIVSKTASQVGGVVKQMVEAGSSAVKQDK